MNDLGLRSHSREDPLVQVIHRGRWNRVAYEPQHHAITLLPLTPRSDHAWIVLRGTHDLVAPLEWKPHLHDLQRLAGIAGQGERFRITGHHAGQPAADVLDLGIEQFIHIERGTHVGHGPVSIHRL